MNLAILFLLLAVWVVGLVILAWKPDWQTIGRVSFAIGLTLFLLYVVAVEHGRLALP